MNCKGCSVPSSIESSSIKFYCTEELSTTMVRDNTGPFHSMKMDQGCTLPWRSQRAFPFAFETLCQYKTGNVFGQIESDV